MVKKELSAFQIIFSMHVALAITNQRFFGRSVSLTAKPSINYYKLDCGYRNIKVKISGEWLDEFWT